MRREVKTVSVLGSSRGEPGDTLYEQVKEIGAKLAELSIKIVTGGYTGVGMMAAPHGAHGKTNSVNLSYAYLLPNKRANAYIGHDIDCGQYSTPDIEYSEYGIRLMGLMQSDGFIVITRGGSGTFIELVTAIHFNRKRWNFSKRIAIYNPVVPHMLGPWNSQLIETLQSWGILGDENIKETLDLIRICITPNETVNWVTYKIE